MKNNIIKELNKAANTMINSDCPFKFHGQRYQVTLLHKFYIKYLSLREYP